ncbi:MAG: type secretion system secretin GspD [Verrucomicrobiota bacterium]|jgi:type II secretory pathway component GspD/PulD (secretin)
MKTTLLLLLAAGFYLPAPPLAAQDNPPAKPAAPVGPRPVQPVTSPESKAKAAADAKETARVALDNEVILELKYDDMELMDLIKSLALQAEINVLFDPKLTQVTRAPDGTVLPAPKVPAFRMINVTARQALEAILANNNLLMVHDPKTNTYRVAPQGALAQEPLLTKIIDLKYTSPTNLAAVLAPGTGILSSRARVIPDARTQRLIISATEHEWDFLTEVLDKLDTPTMQVLIEARILESSRSPQSLRGVDWSGTLQNQSVGFGNGQLSGSVGTSRPGAVTSTTTTLPGGRTITSNTTTPSTTTETLATTVGGIIPGFNVNTRDGLVPAVGFLNADGLRATLSFLNSDAETEVISTPRSVMMDGQTAKLSVTRAFPIFQVTPGSANTPAGSTVIYTNLGTILEVSPRIAANSNISLRVIPEVSNIDSKDRQTINGQVNEANVYAIRRIETQVMIPSGHTLVMGGLITDNVNKGYVKVPGLGDVPGLGWLFRKETKTRAKANLIIFVTPTIIEANHFQAPTTDFLQGQAQPTAADFLGQRPPLLQDKPESFMDSGKPKDWSKKPEAPAKP